MTDKRQNIIDECYREAENCLYTSTALFIWLRILRVFKATFIAAPLILGGFGGWQLLVNSESEALRVSASACAFLAGLFPAIYSALKFDDSLDAVARSAAAFKSLQDRFRQAALIHSQDEIQSFEARFDDLMHRLDDARSCSLTPPEIIFDQARKKVKKGDYTFDYDAGAGKTPKHPPG